jgi:hypothetical protein
MVCLSRFKSHRPENLTAFLPQQPTLVLTPGVRLARQGGLKRAFTSESQNHTVLHPRKIQKIF